MWASLTKDSLRWATFTPSQWRRWLQVVIEKYYTRWENDLTSTPTRACARKLPLFLTRRSSATRQRAMSHIWWSGLGGLVRGYLYQAAGRGEKGEITLFLRSQPWIKRSLKLFVTHRRCWSFWSFGDLFHLHITQPTVVMNFKTPRGALIYSINHGQ